MVATTSRALAEQVSCLMCDLLPWRAAPGPALHGSLVSTSQGLF